MEMLDHWTFRPVNYIGDALKEGAKTTIRQIINDAQVHFWISGEDEDKLEIVVAFFENVDVSFDPAELLNEGVDGEDRQKAAAYLRQLADKLEQDR